MIGYKILAFVSKIMIIMIIIKYFLPHRIHCFSQLAYKTSYEEAIFSNRTVSHQPPAVTKSSFDDASKYQQYLEDQGYLAEVTDQCTYECNFT